MQNNVKNGPKSYYDAYEGIRNAMKGLKNYNLNIGLERALQNYCAAKHFLDYDKYTLKQDKREEYESIINLMQTPIEYYVLNTYRGNLRETEFIKYISQYHDCDISPDEKDRFVLFFRKFKGERRIIDNVEIVSKRFNVKRLMLKYARASEKDKGCMIIPEKHVQIVLNTLLRYFSTYNLTPEELIAFTVEIYYYEFKHLMPFMDCDPIDIFRKCVYYMWFNHMDTSAEDSKKYEKRFISDAAYILDQSWYLNKCEGESKVNRHMTEYAFADNLCSAFMDGLFTYYGHEDDTDLNFMIEEIDEKCDDVYRFLYEVLPNICIYSELVESDDGKRNNWGTIEEILEKVYDNFKIIFSDLIDAYSEKIEMLSEKENERKERMVSMLKDALGKYVSEKEVHEELQRELAPVISSAKSRKEVGFNEEECKVLEGIFMILSEAEKFNNIDFNKVNNVFTYDNEELAKNETALEFVTEFTIAHPNIIDPLLLSERISNIPTDSADNIAALETKNIFTVAKYALNEFGNMVDNSEIKFIEVDDISDMLPHIIKECYEMDSLYDQLSLVQYIANSSMNEAETIKSRVDAANKKIKTDSNNQTLNAFAQKFKDGSYEVARLVDKAADISDPNDKNVFIKTTIIPKLRSFFTIMLATIGAGIFIGPFAAIVALVVGLSLNRNSTVQAKQQVVNELETELSMIDDKISEAERNEDTDKEKNLRLMKKKMEVQYQKFINENNRTHQLVIKGQSNNEPKYFEDD